MSSSDSTATSPASQVRSWITTRPVWLVGLVSLVVGGVVAEIFALAARAIDVPLETPQGFGGGGDPEEIFIGGFIFAALFNGIAGVLIAMGLARWASRPARIWWIVAGVLVVLSFFNPIAAEDTETATKVVLAVSHVIVAAIAVPAIGLRLAAEEREQAATADS